MDRRIYLIGVNIVNEIMLNEYQDIYDTAIEANKKARLESFDEFGHMPVQYYRQEFATVSINLGRRTGKTFYINYKNEYNSDIILTRYSGYSRNDDYSHCVNLFNLGDNFDINRELKGIQFNKFNNIWVDDASMINPRILDEVLWYLYRYKNQTVIMLG